MRQYWLSKWDVIVGSLITDVVAFFIMVACGATLFPHGIHEITDAAEAAVALKPLAGRFASVLFAVGLVNAALLSAAILPLAPPTTSAKASDSSLGWTNGSPRHRCSIPSTPR